MAKYIDADLLRKKITEQMDSVPREVGRGAGTITSTGYGMMQAFQIMRSIIDSLQQEQQEVDLEEEMDRFFEEMPVHEHENIFEDTYHMIARHFYKLGKNSK